MRKKSRKLQLNRETLGVLDRISEVRGGFDFGNNGSFFLCSESCRPCRPDNGNGISNQLSTCMISCANENCHD